MAQTRVGVAVRRREDPRLIQGRGQYVGDLPATRALSVAFVRSPHAHARILRIDTSAAERAPGVVAVYTGADTASLPDLPMFVVDPGQKTAPQHLLAQDRALYAGAPVAAVVAESRYLAEDAAALIEVDYEPLPAVVQPEAAAAEGAPLVHPELGSNVSFVLRKRAGDPDAAFANAAKVVKLRIHQPRLVALSLEPRGIMAQYEPASEELTVWASTQTPFGLRSNLSALLGLGEAQIRVITPDVGGGFGLKAVLYPEEAVTAFAAYRLGRAVRWLGDRLEDMVGTMHGRDVVTYVEGAADAEGRLIGLRVRSYFSLGAHLFFYSCLPPSRTLNLAPGPYRVEHFEGESWGVYTNTIGTGPYRGAGRPEAALIVDRVLDAIAAEMGIDPVVIRERNLIRAEEYPYTSATGTVYDSGNLPEGLARLARLAGYDALRERQRQERAAGRCFGIGLATFTEPSGGVFHESGVVRIEPTGDVTALTGSSPHGQGLTTAFAQVLSDALGIDEQRIRIQHGDTEAVPHGMGTFGSRSLLTGGTALLLAAQDVVERAKRIAAHLLEAAPEDVQLAGGRFSVAGSPDRSVGWPEVARLAYSPRLLPPGEPVGLEATRVFTPSSDTYGTGAYLAVVSIDVDTGQLHVERLVAVDDCGTVVNPLLVEGQVHGGIAQGVGQALLEEMAYGPDGQPLTGTLMDYLAPTAEAIPPLQLDHTVTPSPLNPLGAKGVGEAGIIGASIAILNAACDALAPYGVRSLDLPLRPDKLWAAIHCRPEAAMSSQ